ncbi:Signal peptidase I [hydrothermal vent metagenome]|uniref:signal peptidase I n=1 Tax=hydrothermal vent metagenome TaxID=652676 RepID=A0A1W1CJT0_9ZZZZ
MRFLKAFHRFSSSWTGTIIIVLFLIFFVIQSFVIPSGSMKRTMHVGDFLFAKKFSYGIPIPTIPWLQMPIVPDFNDNGHLIEGDKPKREDIVIFLFPHNHKVHYVKRCVAIGGDEIVYQDKHLYIHFSEGDEYITKNYSAQKIKKFRGKLWVDNPYMDKYPGIQYVPDNHDNIFKLLMRSYMYGGADNIDMIPIYVQELGGEVLNIREKPANALYKKVEEGKYYMMGDNRDNSNDSRFWGSVPYKLIIGKPWLIYFSWDNENKKVRWDRLGTFVDDLQHEKPRY